MAKGALKKTGVKKHTETQEHRLLCLWMKIQHPNVMFNTDLSGVRLTPGLANQVKNLRSNNGFPDLVIYEKRGEYGACFIELKRTGEKIFKKDGESAINEHIQNQLITNFKLANRGYFAIIAIGFEEAKQIITNYLNLK